MRQLYRTRRQERIDPRQAAQLVDDMRRRPAGRAGDERPPVQMLAAGRSRLRAASGRSKPATALTAARSGRCAVACSARRPGRAGLAGHGVEPVLEEFSGRPSVSHDNELSDDELEEPANSDEEELAPSGLPFDDVDVKEPDRVAPDLLRFGSIASGHEAYPI